MAGKGKGKKKEKEPKDKFTNMEEDKLIEFIQKTKDQIKEVKVKRNFVQQESIIANALLPFNLLINPMNKDRQSSRNPGHPICACRLCILSRPFFHRISAIHDYP